MTKKNIEDGNLNSTFATEKSVAKLTRSQICDLFFGHKIVNKRPNNAWYTVAQIRSQNRSQNFAIDFSRKYFCDEGICDIQNQSQMVCAIELAHFAAKKSVATRQFFCNVSSKLFLK